MHEPTVFNLEGRECFAYPLGESDAYSLLVIPQGTDYKEEMEQIIQLISPAVEGGNCPPLVISGFVSEDWNRDFSPWESPPLFKKADAFAGMAGETLSFITDTFLPRLETRVPLSGKAEDRGMIGYSLAGLFSLWAMCNTSAFSLYGSCSGSLWYNGWVDYVSTKDVPAVSKVYMSLGNKESHTKNQLMSKVDEATQFTYETLKASPSVNDVYFEWNEGGHFGDTASRITKAVEWLMGNRL